MAIRIVRKRTYDRVEGTPISATATWVYEIIIKGPKVRTIKFDKSYIQGNNSLQVFCDGLLLDLGEQNDYIESDDTSITFNYDLDLEDNIKVICASGVFLWYQKFVSVKDQVTFITTNKFSPHADDILVYENGILLCSDEDYKEDRYNSITFMESPPEDSCIKVYRRR